MTTHKGLGANTAFVDAQKLKKSLQSMNWREALSKYEDDMAIRGFAAVKESLQSTLTLHSSGWKASARDWFVWTIGCVLWAKTKVFG